MKVCVLGIWHLGAVTSACLASLGHSVVGVDPSLDNINNLNKGIAPVFEPGLNDLISRGIDSGLLTYSSDIRTSMDKSEILWVTFDTPVDDNDDADVKYVLNYVELALEYLSSNAYIIISSQLPVGSVADLEKFAFKNFKNKNFSFFCAPENLRLGKSLKVFQDPDRLVVGFRGDDSKRALAGFLSSITQKIEWMSIESAEMTKHAINAFLATSIAFSNEIASICEFVGADAKDVERGLKTEERIGPKAYLSPGGSFAGGTLARDISFLSIKSKDFGLPIKLLNSVKTSNDAHKDWSKRKLLENFSSLQDIIVVVWGLTYKVGTDTLRRSLSVELCDWLLEHGALVRVSDPAVKNLPDRWNSTAMKFDSPLEAVAGAHALVVGTEWPEFRENLKSSTQILSNNLLVLDANRFIYDLVDQSQVKYLAVGTPVKRMII
jgi:UDPglucose 6-dehydrogenase